MATKKVKVRVLQATIDGKGPGEVVSVSEKSAKHLVKIRYAAYVGAAPDSDKEDGGDGEGGDGDDK